MATRRMFSIRLVNSARFLRMPISSQALYFHLGLHADDDGVVEAYPVIKTIGCTEDDLRVLVAKGFVQVLNEDLVSYITDWNEHNTIRPDRKIDSIYKDLLIQVNPEVKLVEKRPRADIAPPVDNQWTDNGQTTDGIGKDRLGKYRLEEDNNPPNPPKRGKRFTPPTVEEVREYCRERGNSVNAEQFVDFYASKNWMVGKNKMVDFKAAVRNWERREKEKPKQGNTFSSGMMQRPKDDVAKVLADLGNRNGNLI